MSGIDVGKRIQERRKALGLSQDELALKLGLTSKSSRSVVSKLEKDASNITTDRISLIAKVLGCTPAYLMGWEDIPNAKEAGRLAAELIKDTEVLSRASRLHHASESDRETIFRVIDSILGN